MTQAAVAAACGVNVSFISHLESDRNAPSREVLFRLAEVFQVSAQYLETGQLGPEDEAKRARFAFWPEICYLLANHVAVPRLRNPDSRLSDDEAISGALRRAWDARHFCEYKLWAQSREGRRTAAAFEGRGSLERLIESVAQHTLSPGGWIDLAHPSKPRLALSPKRTRKGHDHCYSQAMTSTEPRPGHCFEFDMEASAQYFSDFHFGFFRSRSQDYWERPFTEAFVNKAFAPIFWTASRLWSDRRLVGWLWALDMPFDVYGPLIHIARQCDGHERYETSARRLLDQATLEDRDVFLGTFVDIYSSPARYRAEFNERPLTGGPVVEGGGAIRPGSWMPARRRRKRLQTRSHLYLDAIYLAGGTNACSEAEAWLREKAPPHTFKQEDILKLTDAESNGHCGGEIDEEPPETLP
ncbi:MAG: helix-turn-helix transcriptional regulator [Phycisphaerae bacterium]|nr:helix-turn-helix transcriptional regulator [Phycisphaerae bacterium]